MKMKPLIGTSIYELVKYPLLNALAFLDAAAGAGANCHEFFLNWSWWEGYNWEPFLIDHWKDEDGIHSPVFDLSKPNVDMWDKYLAIFKRMKLNRMVPIIRIHDFCSLKRREDKRAYWVINNVQRENGQLRGGVWEEGVRPIYHRLNVKLLAKLAAAKIKRFYLVPMSEADVLTEGGWNENDGDFYQLDFHKWYIKDLMSLGVKKSQIIISNGRARTTEALRALGCRMEIHGINSDVALKPGVNIGPNLFPNGDGHDAAAAGIADYMGWREPSAEQARAMVEKIRGTFGYCYINRGYQPPGINGKTGKGASPLKANFEALRELAKARE